MALDPKLQAGAAGQIELKAKNKSSIQKKQIDKTTRPITFGKNMKKGAAGASTRRAAAGADGGGSSREVSPSRKASSRRRRAARPTRTCQR